MTVDEQMIQLLQTATRQNDIMNEQLNNISEFNGSIVIMLGFLCLIVAFVAGYLITKGKN